MKNLKVGIIWVKLSSKYVMGKDNLLMQRLNDLVVFVMLEFMLIAMTIKTLETKLSCSMLLRTFTGPYWSAPTASG